MKLSILIQRFKIPFRLSLSSSSLLARRFVLFQNKKIHDKKELNENFHPDYNSRRGYGFSFSKVHDEIFISFPSGALGSLKISIVGRMFFSGVE